MTLGVLGGDVKIKGSESFATFSQDSVIFRFLSSTENRHEHDADARRKELLAYGIVHCVWARLSLLAGMFGGRGGRRCDLGWDERFLGINVVPFPVLYGGFVIPLNIWLAVMGVLMWRRAGRLPSVADNAQLMELPQWK